MSSAYEQGQVPDIVLRHRLRIAREYAGLDQEQLANRMEVTRSTISNAESGKGVPRPATVNAWALACGVPASWLKTGQDPPPEDATLGLRIISRPRRQYLSREIGNLFPFESTELPRRPVRLW